MLFQLIESENRAKLHYLVCILHIIYPMSGGKNFPPFVLLNGNIINIIWDNWDNMKRYYSDTEGNLMNLSTREDNVLALVASGFSYKEIALKLKISTRTVHTYMDRSIFKLGANNRSNAVAKYIALKSSYKS